MKKLISKLIKPCIVFESKPEFPDNTMAVYQEMLRRGLDRRYRLVWYVNWDKCAGMHNGRLEYWDPHNRKTIAGKIRNYSYFFKTRCIICCNDFLKARGDGCLFQGKDKLSFYLSHGTPMKSVKEYYTCEDGVDYILSPAPALNTLMASEFSFSEDQVFAAGFPRNDAFSGEKIDLRAKLKRDFKKVMIWYPTYRQHKNGKVSTSTVALPIIHDVMKAKQLNETARDNNVLILLKPHPAQDVSLIRDLGLSNVLMIDESFFEEHDITSYQLLASSDALITDYSSVYFDYTLCDKPIAVIWEDIEEYSKFPGFAIDLTFYLKGAEKVYNLEELQSFVRDVAEGRDKLQAERREIRDLCNYSTDGRNSKRVVDFIVKTAKL